MAENEGMEGKDLALEEKKEFEARILEAVKDLKTGESTTSLEGLEVTSYGEQSTIKLKGITFGIIDKNGKFTYNRENFVALKEALQEEGQTLEELGLPDIEKFIEQEQIKKEENKPEHTETTKEEKEYQKEEQEPEKGIEDDKDEIAESLGIDAKKIYPIREDSAFYNNHIGMFPNKDLFFYEDKEGKIRVGTRDEKGNPIEDTVHFSSKQVEQMEPVIRLGNGKEDVRKEIPLQTITINNPARGTEDEDVQDRYIAVFIGNGGYLEFEEVEQSRTKGEPGVAERIELSGKEYNTKEMNERTANGKGGQTPGETIENFDSVEVSEHAEDGVQPNEIFSDNEDYVEDIKKDIIKIYGPMKDDDLKKMTKNVMERIESGEKRDEAISRAGIEERPEGGQRRGEARRDPRRG